MASFEVKQGDTRVLRIQVTEDDNLTPVPLTGCLVVFVMRDPGTLAPVLTANATVEDVLNGRISYPFTATDTAIPGAYLGEFQITFPNLERITVPEGSYITIEVTPALDTATFPDPAGTSVADWLEEVRQHLEGAQRTAQNLIGSPLDHTQTSVVLQADIGPLNPGDRLSAGLETFYVTAYDRTRRTATVVRGASNSPITNHSDGELVRVNPRWTNYEMFRALNTGLGRLSSAGLWAPRTLLRTVDTISRTYDLAADMVGKRILEVSYLEPGNLNRWCEVRDFDVLLSVDTTTYTSGRVLTIGEPLTNGQPLRILYRAKLGSLSSLVDDVDIATGLQSTAFDLPPLAAVLHLTAGSAVQRADTRGQGGTRRAEEVSTTDVLQSPGALRSLYKERINEEITRLNQLYESKTRLRRFLR